MDKKSVLAIILITIIILLWPAYMKMIRGDQEAYLVQKQSEDNDKKDSLINLNSMHIDETGENVEEKVKEEKAVFLNESDQETIPIFIEIETPLIKTKLSNLGGGKIESWVLKNYLTWEKKYVTIVDSIFNNGLEFGFNSTNGNKVNFNDYYFESDYIENKKIVLKSNELISIPFRMNFNGIEVEKVFTFYGDDYHFDVSFQIRNYENYLLNDEYYVFWKNGLPSNESNSQEDFTYSESYVWMGDELENYTIDEEGASQQKVFTGSAEWIATRTKYFLSAILVKSAKVSAVQFSGVGQKKNDIIERKYNNFLNISKNNNAAIDSFRVYLGPLDYSVLSSYNSNLEKLIMNHGWYERAFRPVSLLILAVFKFFKLFISNYGVIIIIFSILIKIVVYPLTKKSYKSMREMSKVQPLLAEIREKYKGDPQRMNRETMKLYKDHNINPMGGCLPTLLQLPLLAALFIVFRSTIQLRGASFIPGWIDDLSSADTIAILPFSLPMYGNQFNLLPIIMAVTMIIQSKMSIQDPKQKALVYLMPIFLLFLFNTFPSGLNLYYALFNIWTIIQQKFIDGNSQTELKSIISKSDKKNKK